MKNIVTHDIETEITQIVTRISELTGLPFEIVIKTILESVLDERSGKSEEECRQIMSGKIDQYKLEYTAPTTIR